MNAWQGVGSDSFGDPGLAGDAADDSGGGVAFEAAVVVAAEDGAFGAFPNGEVNRAGGAGREGDGDDLAAFADNPKIGCEAVGLQAIRRWCRSAAIWADRE